MDLADIVMELETMVARNVSTSACEKLNNGAHRRWSYGELQLGGLQEQVDTVPFTVEEDEVNCHR